MMPEPGEESLAVLLLPSKLEEFELGAHARGLLSIPRVVALEPPRFRTPRLMRNAVGIRQARRLPFPGRPRMIVLYHPAQYPLAQALLSHDDELELWYIAPDVESLTGSSELNDLDDLARAHATQIVPVRDGTDVSDEDLRERMRELDVINARAFIPVARSRRASSRRR
jgi:hypothetical protein